MRNSTFQLVCLISIGILCSCNSLCADTNTSTGGLTPFTQQQDTVNNYLEINGSIRERLVKNIMGDSGDNPWLDSAIVTVYYNNAVYKRVYTTRRGKCNFQLPLDRIYTVELSKPGYVSKKFEVNTKTPPNKRDAYDFYFDMDIFEYIEGLDTKLLEKPLAIVYYNITNNQFEYDAAYTNRINSDLQLLYRNYYMLEHAPKKKKK
ncbi:MAG TPA: hypothetical protein VFF27_14995 [Bacteroidia bacterium]|jgi:hypothetical protein|nr:hypothetical protein [Bacteroidia bacterium]